MIATPYPIAGHRGVISTADQGRLEVIPDESDQLFLWLTQQLCRINEKFRA